MFQFGGHHINFEPALKENSFKIGSLFRNGQSAAQWSGPPSEPAYCAKIFSKPAGFVRIAISLQRARFSASADAVEKNPAF